MKAIDIEPLRTETEQRRGRAVFAARPCSARWL